MGPVDKMWVVLDNRFNRANYPDEIGTGYYSKPKIKAQVAELGYEEAQGEMRRVSTKHQRIRESRERFKARYARPGEPRIRKIKPSALSGLLPMPPSEGPPLPKAMNIRWKKPGRDEVEVDVWEERDRLSIVIRDKATQQKVYAEWWDDDARQMFEDGFFERRRLENSVLDYAEEMGIIKP